jgi:hypothetical protein
MSTTLMVLTTSQRNGRSRNVAGRRSKKSGRTVPPTSAMIWAKAQTVTISGASRRAPEMKALRKVTKRDSVLGRDDVTDMLVELAVRERAMHGKTRWK